MGKRYSTRGKPPAGFSPPSCAKIAPSFSQGGQTTMSTETAKLCRLWQRLAPLQSLGHGRGSCKSTPRGFGAGLELLLLAGLLLTAGLGLRAGDTAAAKPPETRRDAVKEGLHRGELADPYRWLEDQQSPETRAWIDAQNAYTQSRLGVVPGRDLLKQRLTELLRIDTVGFPPAR